jgi:Integrase core domain
MWNAHGPDGLTIRPRPGGNSRRRKAPQASCRITESSDRFDETVLNEFYRVAFRKKIYASISELQDDLDAWIRSYNEDRPQQGCFGKTPLQTFLDVIPAGF